MLFLRISDIASWRWVLDDLTKRLKDAIETLHYERNALQVVIERIQNEIVIHSREASQPGALKPQSDNVEEVILQVKYTIYFYLFFSIVNRHATPYRRVGMYRK